MKLPSLRPRTLALVGILATLAALFAFVALRTGPLAPVPVTVATAEELAIAPALFGVGTIKARYTYKIGPTVAGRVKSVDVDVGNSVRAGQQLGEMDPVDIDERIAAIEASINRGRAAVVAAEAQVQDALARRSYSAAQAQRYEQLWQTRTVSDVAVEAKRQDIRVAEAAHATATANRDAARQELVRLASEREGLIQQRARMRLIAPVNGLVVLRNADPGTTVVAGQAVVEVIDPDNLWINVRFNQLGLSGLRAGLPARIVLRSQPGQITAGHVLRVEPVADAVTEETLAKVVFEKLPDILPPVGELAEVTVALPALPVSTVVPDASVQRIDGRLGVWTIKDDALRFVPIKTGATDLDGRVQVLEGLTAGEHVVVFSLGTLSSRSRVKVVANLTGAPS